MVLVITRLSSGLSQLQQFKEDNEEVGFGSASQAVEQALERTTANMKWVAENKAKVLKWFEDESKSTLDL